MSRWKIKTPSCLYDGFTRAWFALHKQTCMAGELHPRVALLEGHDEGGPVHHGLQLMPRLILEEKQKAVIVDI